MAAHTSASYGHKMHITSGSNGRFHPLKPENMQPSFKSHIEKESRKWQGSEQEDLKVIRRVPICRPTVSSGAVQEHTLSLVLLMLPALAKILLCGSPNLIADGERPFKNTRRVKTDLTTTHKGAVG